jgi:hypothetical protein
MPRRRWLFVLLVGIACGTMSYLLIGREGYASDLLFFWHATRALLQGADPYSPLVGVDLNPGLEPALNPLPAFFVFLPFAQFPLPLAGGLFMGIGSALAAWGVSGTGMARAPLFLSASFILSLSLGQWSPWLLAAALIPWLSWIIVAKPNVGLPVWIARPAWQTVAAVALVLAISLAVAPEWPSRWLSAIAGHEGKFVPLFRPGGFLLLASAIAWRRPEGRLLFAMSAVPQTLLFYDQLLLWLVPRTLRQSLLLSIWSGLACLLWQHNLAAGDYYVREAVPYAYSVYFVALVQVLWNWWTERRHAVSVDGTAVGS